MTMCDDHEPLIHFEIIFSMTLSHENLAIKFCGSSTLSSIFYTLGFCF